MRRLLLSVVLLLGAAVAVPTAGAAPSLCPTRTLVLSAMPVELGPLLAREQRRRVVAIAGRDFYVGRLRGHEVVLALTGIGPVNAARTTQLALRTFRCGSRPSIGSVVFSGVAGGDYIGDVTVPARWTLDGGKHFVAVDPAMLATARRVARSRPALERTAPVGDPACGCLTPADALTTVSVTHPPRVEVGGAGQTTDPFAGRPLPCAPGGGDVFGCEPCVVQTHAGEVGGLAAGALPFADPRFFTGYFAAPGEGAGYVAEDEETAAVATVAAAHGLPFIGVRAVSDGGGDPLGLPGFPVQFFYYRQLAADNAAIVTLDLLATTTHPIPSR